MHPYWVAIVSNQYILDWALIRLQPALQSAMFSTQPFSASYRDFKGENTLARQTNKAEWFAFATGSSPYFIISMTLNKEGKQRFLWQTIPA